MSSPEVDIWSVDHKRASEFNGEWLKQKGRTPKYPVVVEEENKLQAQIECVENEMNKDRHHLASSPGSTLPNEAGNPTNVVI